MNDYEANAEVLRRMTADGDDLTLPRAIDFLQVFPDEAAARAFAAEVRRDGLHAKLEGDGPAEGLPWDVTVVVHMAADCAAITAMQQRLHALATTHGGRADGWGCFATPAGSDG